MLRAGVAKRWSDGADDNVSDSRRIGFAFFSALNVGVFLLSQQSRSSPLRRYFTKTFVQALSGRCSILRDV